MRKVLYILGSLADTDVDWLVSTGRAVILPAGVPLIQEGKHLDALFIVLEGSLGITVAAMPGKILATAGPGEVLGEISMLDSRPPWRRSQPKPIVASCGFRVRAWMKNSEKIQVSDLVSTALWPCSLHSECGTERRHLRGSRTV